jgi:hypothetical protein
MHVIIIIILYYIIITYYYIFIMQLNHIIVLCNYIIIMLHMAMHSLGRAVSLFARVRAVVSWGGLELSAGL